MTNLLFSTSPMNLTITAVNPLWLRIYFHVFGAISFSINMLSLYCILRKSSKEMVIYKWFLFNIWFWSFTMDWLVMLFIQPISWFPLFGGASSLKFTAHWNKDLLFLSLMFASGCLCNCTMSLVAGIFYRWQVLYPHSVFLQTYQRTTVVVAAIHLCYLTPGGVVLWIIRPNGNMEEFIKYHVVNAEELFDYAHIVLHRDITENAVLAIVTYSLGIAMVIVVSGAMLWDSYRLLYLLKENLISEQTKRMHTQMLFSLLMQAVIPLTSYGAPICSACLMILLDFKTENMQEQTTYMIAVFCTHSTLSCIVLLTTVKCYRTAVMKILHLHRFQRRNTVEMSLSTDVDLAQTRF